MKSTELPWILRGQPWAVSERRPMFRGIFDDVEVSNMKVLAVPVAVMSLSTRNFVEHVIRRVPKEHHIKFKMGSEVLTGFVVGELAGAVVDVWRSERKADRVHHALAGQCIDQIIRTVQEKAPDAIQTIFGADLFKPVKP